MHVIRWWPEFATNVSTKYNLFGINWHYGRFPLIKNLQFNFSESLLFECKASDRLPEFEVMCSATQACWVEFVVLKNGVFFLNIFEGLKQEDSETIGCTILDNNYGPA